MRGVTYALLALVFEIDNVHAVDRVEKAGSAVFMVGFVVAAVFWAIWSKDK